MKFIEVVLVGEVFFFFFFLCHGCFSPRCTTMNCHKVCFRAVSHNSVRCLKNLLKFFVNVDCCDPLARFPGSLPLSARFSIFSLRITCPTNSSCLFLYIEANSVFDLFSEEPFRLFDVLSMRYVKFCGRTTFPLLQFFV